MKARPEDYPVGHPTRIQIEKAMAAMPKRETEEVGALQAMERAKRSHPETDLQIRLVSRADEWPLRTIVRADLRPRWPTEILHTTVGHWLWHPPNGGHRNATEAAIFRAMGVRAGVLDLFFMLPVVRSRFVVDNQHGEDVVSEPTYRAGLFLECKAAGGRMTDHQERFAEQAELVCYDVYRECRSEWDFDAAIETYLEGAIPWASL